jgi:hypothetical protein
MGKRITFVAGLAVGYVLGARAGRERYEQIRRNTRRVMDSDTAHKAGHAAAGFAHEAGGRVGQRLGERLPERVGRHLPERFGGRTHNTNGHGRYEQGL